MIKNDQVPRLVHHARHEDGGADEITATGLTGAGGGEFISKQQRHFYGRLPVSTGNGTIVADTAYWTYLGKTSSSFTPGHVFFHMGNAGTGTQVAQVCYATTPNAPSRAGQTLTVVDVVSSVDTLTASGNTFKGNTSAFSNAVSANVHLWVGLRINMTGMPNPAFSTFDMGQGEMLVTATAGTLTAGGTYAGATIASNAQHPFIMLTLD